MSELLEIQDSTETIARHLQSAADRCCHVSVNPPSAKQIWYLARLIREAGRDARDVGCHVTQTNSVLSAGLASRYITDYLKPVPTAEEIAEIERAREERKAEAKRHHEQFMQAKRDEEAEKDDAICYCRDTDDPECRDLTERFARIRTKLAETFVNKWGAEERVYRGKKRRVLAKRRRHVIKQMIALHAAVIRA